MKRIIIDTDMGSDDYIAIQLAALSKKIKIEGVSLVYGNTDMNNVKRNIFKTLDMINMSEKIKVYEGEQTSIYKHPVNPEDNAHGSNGFSDVIYEDVNGTIENISAIDWMIDTVNTNQHKITIIVIGPLTNIAKAILKDDCFHKNIKQLIIMGGAENFGNITPYAEFNFYKDPEAAKIVFEAGIKNIKLIGFNVTKKVTLDKNLEELLNNSKDENAKFIYNITRDTAKLDREKNKVDGAIINDAVNVCYLLNKNSVKFKKACVEIETNDQVRLGESKVSYGKKANCKIAKDVDQILCKKIIFNTIIPNIKKK